MTLLGWAKENKSLDTNCQQSLSSLLLISTQTWIIEKYSCVDNGANIAHNITNGTALIFSDEAHGPLASYGGALWVVHPGTDRHKCWAWYHTPGINASQYPYLSELSGILGGLYTIECITILYNILSGYVTIA